MKTIMLRTLLLCLLTIAGRSNAGDSNLEPVATTDVKAQLQTYFFDAARAGHVPMLQEFITAGYDLNSRDPKGYTALILSAYHGHSEAVDVLIKAGADVCAEDRSGNTALMGAIFKGELTIARKLMAADCTPDHRNAAGQTPAMYAALFQRTEILQSLKERGADLKAADAAGNTVENLVRGEIRVRPPQP